MPPPQQPMNLEAQRTALILIDVQEKLTAVMPDRDDLVRSLVKLVGGLQILDIPILWFEQNPDRMGPTIAALREILQHTNAPIPKMSFSCCGATQCMHALQATGRDQILIAGIETHVCVYQTAAHLLDLHLHVQIVVDAISSRKPLDQAVALQRLLSAAATRQQTLPPLTTTETALFEIMQTAEHPRFRDILKIIR